MHVSLPAAQAAFVAEQVESGHYIDEAEVIRDALRLFQEHQQRPGPTDGIFEVLLLILREMGAEKRADRSAREKDLEVKLRAAEEALHDAVTSVTEQQREAAEKWDHAFQQRGPASNDTAFAPPPASAKPTTTGESGDD